jgi:hypothetical protein
MQEEPVEAENNTLDLGPQTGKMMADERASPSRGRDARTLRTVFVSGEIAAKNLAARRF